MSLLTIINDAQDMLGLKRTTDALDSNDQAARTLATIAAREARDLAARHPWQALIREKSITATATETQTGAIPDDFDRMINETFFNRTRKRRVIGPLDPVEWQAHKALSASVLTDAFRIRGDAILLVPTPSAGDSYYYEYVSSHWAHGVEPPVETDASWWIDGNETYLSEELILLGVIWRFKKLNGLDYAEDFATYERRVTDAIMRDGARRTLSFSFDDRLYDHSRPPTIPEGSWSL